MSLHDVLSSLRIMDVPIYSDQTVAYEHVLQGLIRYRLHLNMVNLRKTYRRKHVTRYTLLDMYAVQLLQRAYRRRLALRAKSCVPLC